MPTMLSNSKLFKIDVIKHDSINAFDRIYHEVIIDGHYFCDDLECQSRENLTDSIDNEEV